MTCKTILTADSLIILLKLDKTGRIAVADLT